MKPTLHLIAPFHTVLNAAHSHCAFSGKAMRFSAMMQNAGYRCIEYSNGTSESDCTSKVSLLAETELPVPGVFHGDTAVIGSLHWKKFDERLRSALENNANPGDIVCHTFGRSHSKLVEDYANVFHVETGVGYPDAEYGCNARVFESYAWMHWHAGQAHTRGNDYQFVIPNYYTISEWEPCFAPGSYLLYFGRICEQKGMPVLRAIAEAGHKIKCVGQGDSTEWTHPNLEFLPPVTGKNRSELLGGARALLMPTRYIEPFGGSGIEGMLCGTPLLAPDHSAFSETIEHGVNGFRCHTLGDWITAIGALESIDRHTVARGARKRYSTEACGKLYDAVFTQVWDLRSDGWATLEPHMLRALYKA